MDINNAKEIKAVEAKMIVAAEKLNKLSKQEGFKEYLNEVRQINQDCMASAMSTNDMKEIKFFQAGYWLTNALLNVVDIINESAEAIEQEPTKK
jgi:hypothetical protein